MSDVNDSDYTSDDEGLFDDTDADSDSDSHKLNETSSNEPSNISAHLSMRDAQRIIQDDHGMSVSKDDPVLIVVTLMNALLDKQRAVWRSDQKSSREETQRGMEEVVSKVSGELLQNSLQETFERVAQQVDEATRVMESMKRLRWWLTVLTGLVMLATLATWTIIFTR